MASIEFTAYPRQGEGRGASRRLRRGGKAPGIVYGAGVDPTPIELDHNALIHALRNEAFHASILSMTLDGKAQKVLLRDVQMHPFRAQVLHVDFQRIDEGKKIHMRVPLHYVNEAASPAVKLGEASNVRIVSRDRVARTLQLMRQPAGATLTPELAQQVCDRVAADTVIDGHISNIGEQFMLVAGMTPCGGAKASVFA